MTPDGQDGAPAYASAAHAARLIGKSERTVQLWMEEAGHQDTRIVGAGYPVGLLCEVVNRHKWPHKFVVTPEHFLVDTGPTEDSREEIGPANDAALAVYGQLDALQRLLLAGEERQAALAADLAELRAQVAQLLADNARQRERDEKAAQLREDARSDVVAALDRIERGQRRKGWFARLLGR